jgi:multidrug resistance protein
VNTISPSTPALRDVLIALMSAIFLGALDQTIVAVSMPAISAQFADVGLLAWVISGYMVAMTIATPVYGKLGDLYGRRRMILIGMGVFTAASALCALAQSMEQLVLARILQGIGAGGMVSVSQAIIGDVVPPRERGRYQGYFSSMYAAASVAGPIAGGLMTEYLSWRWVFWLNLPLGIAAWLFIRRTLAGLQTPQRKARIDYLGTLLMIVGLGALLLAITDVGQGHAWHSTQVLGLFATGVLALVVFVWHERRCAEPLLPLRLFAECDRRYGRCRRPVSATAGLRAAHRGFLRRAPHRAQRALQAGHPGRGIAGACQRSGHGLYTHCQPVAELCVHVAHRHRLRPSVPHVTGWRTKCSATGRYRREYQYHQPVPLAGRRRRGCSDVGPFAGLAGGRS